jgi:very-short-patch-repair endonuclease
MIYHDLDSSKWPEDKKPFHHKTLKALFESGFIEPQPQATEAHNLDTETNAAELFQVVDADSSQILAMLAVNEGRNMVIQGPPGTGKSQTITNIIANAIGQGKKVLFVAEKMAALEVVKRRLDSIGLGEACLELHSHKANKKELHEELKRVMDLGKPALSTLQQEISFLKENKDELNAYCSAINKAIANSGLTAQNIIGYLLQISAQTGDIKIPNIQINAIESWNAEQMNRAEVLAERIEVRLKDIGLPSELLFWGSQLTSFLPHEHDSLLQLLHVAYQSTNELQQEADSIATQFGISSPINISATFTLINLNDLAAQSPDLSGLNIQDDAWILNKDDIEDAIDTGERLSILHETYKNTFLPEAWDQNVLEIRQNLIAHGSKWYKFIIGSFNKSLKQLSSFTKVKLSTDLDVRLKYVDAILECRRLEASKKEMDALMLRLFGSRWHKQKTDWLAIKESSKYLLTLHQDISANKTPKEIFTYLAKNPNPEIARKHAESLKQKVIQHEASLRVLLDKLKMDEEKRSADNPLIGTLFSEQLNVLIEWKGRIPEVQQVIAWNNMEDAARQEELSFLTAAAVDWPDAGNWLKIALQKSWYEYLIEHAMSSSAPLRKFERTNHEEIVAHFKKLDLLKLQYNRVRVAIKHWDNVPRQEAGGQVNILKGEFNRKARHMPIRKLIQEAGMAIQAIKPVFMMGPMSIANFLVPGCIEFDLVIFDEASRVRPVDALGALLRAKQLVVVGDTKQMPPTSFFDKMNTDTEDEENVTADMQSILGMCNAQGAPERMLRWHYRSRHESLISLSNHEFYENRLVIFPSPGSKSRMGLAFHHLPEAIYDRGKTRTNPKEAEAVADAVIDHVLKNPKQTLGVVAFSTAQMQAIQFAIENRRRKSPEVEGFFRAHAHEPFFVKNLENVQGDERDVIFISIGYGRIEDGKVPLSFGPLNNEGGERRLNVLITRAKLRCEVFTNITSEDIKTSDTTKFGIRALKSFLYFAQHGKFNIDKDIPLPVKRPFEDVVAEELTQSGYTIHKQVGSEGFYLDMAVVDPENPGRYLMAIECDGEAYAAAKSASDRDRLRTQVLESIGWKTYRVWSTDWFRNPERELRRLITAIEIAKEQTALDDTVAEELQRELDSMIREEVAEVTVLLPVYEKAILPAEVSHFELHLQPFGKLGEWIQAVVKVESPIHFEEMARRIADANGVSKIGSRIRYTISAATEFADNSGLIKRKGDFLWHPQMEVPFIRERSQLSSSSRRLEYISPEEMGMAIKKVVESSIAIQPDSAVNFVAKLFGFARVTEEMRKEILKSIDDVVQKGTVLRDGDFLKV